MGARLLEVLPRRRRRRRRLRTRVTHSSGVAKLAASNVPPCTPNTTCCSRVAPSRMPRIAASPAAAPTTPVLPCPRAAFAASCTPHTSASYNSPESTMVLNSCNGTASMPRCRATSRHSGRHVNVTTGSPGVVPGGLAGRCAWPPGAAAYVLTACRRPVSCPAVTDAPAQDVPAQEGVAAACMLLCYSLEITMWAWGLPGVAAAVLHCTSCRRPNVPA